MQRKRRSELNKMYYAAKADYEPAVGYDSKASQPGASYRSRQCGGSCPICTRCRG